jgi:hypothetical protein
MVSIIKAFFVLVKLMAALQLTFKEVDLLREFPLNVLWGCGTLWLVRTLLALHQAPYVSEWLPRSLCCISITKLTVLVFWAL